MTAQTIKPPQAAPSLNLSRQYMIGAILLIALFSFEIFNFDTTQYALANLLGEVSFVGLKWASILAIAFCAIDFAGLARIFTPQKGFDEPKEVWYLMGAWLLGATMNAVMTWWAVSLTLLNHDFGNEVLSRSQLLTAVPIFVAVLVWLTRILFIGAISIAGDQWFDFAKTDARPASSKARPQQSSPQLARLKPSAKPRYRPAPQPDVWTGAPQYAGMAAYADPATIPEPSVFAEADPLNQPSTRTEQIDEVEPVIVEEVPTQRTRPQTTTPRQTRRPSAPPPRTNYRAVPMQMQGRQSER